MKIRPLYRDCLVWFVVVPLSATTLSLILTSYASFPPIGEVPFSVACERQNTLGTWFSAFVIVLCLGAMFVVLREITRCALGDTPRLSFWQACDAFWRGGRKRTTCSKMTLSQNHNADDGCVGGKRKRRDGTDDNS